MELQIPPSPIDDLNTLGRGHRDDLTTSSRGLFLIEAVTSHGPVSPKRLLELEAFLKDCKVGKVYVTAFPDMAEFKKHSGNIAWETEVWLMEVPDHMIHFNGDRFMGPR